MPPAMSKRIHFKFSESLAQAKVPGLPSFTLLKCEHMLFTEQGREENPGTAVGPTG